jgi:hypothetical protein
MKKNPGSALLLVAGLLAAGCVVRSIHPWLSEESRVEEPSLLGLWHDAQAESVVSFASEPAASDYTYSLLLTNAKNETSRFAANLHRIDHTLLLVVAPAPRDDIGVFATLPGHLLFKVRLGKNSLRLQEIDLDSFEERAAKSRIPLLADGSKNDGYVLTGTTDEAEAFLRSQLAAPGFFEKKPLYSFRRLAAPARGK